MGNLANSVQWILDHSAIHLVGIDYTSVATYTDLRGPHVVLLPNVSLAPCLPDLLPLAVLFVAPSINPAVYNANALMTCHPWMYRGCLDVYNFCSLV